MTKLPRDLRFYTFAIPISVFAGLGYADSFKTYAKFLNTYVSIAAPAGKQRVVHNELQSTEPSYGFSEKQHAHDLRTRLMERRQQNNGMDR